MAWTTHRIYTGSEGSMCWLPVTSPAGRVPVIYCHGLLGSSTTPTWRTSGTGGSADEFRLLADAGHPVFIADLGGAATWGNDTAIARVDTLVTYAATTFGTRTDKVAITGESMGACLALNWAWRNPSKVAACWIRSPVVALDYCHDRNPGAFAATIEAAYGGLAAYEAALPTHDPRLNWANLVALGSRMLAHAAISDDIVLITEVREFANAVGCELEEVPGEHGDTYDIDATELAAWLVQTVADNL